MWIKYSKEMKAGLGGYLSREINNVLMQVNKFSLIIEFGEV